MVISSWKPSIRIRVTKSVAFGESFHMTRLQKKDRPSQTYCKTKHNTVLCSDNIMYCFLENLNDVGWQCSYKLSTTVRENPPPSTYWFSEQWKYGFGFTYNLILRTSRSQTSENEFLYMKLGYTQSTLVLRSGLFHGDNCTFKYNNCIFFKCLTILNQ